MSKSVLLSVVLLSASVSFSAQTNKDSYPDYTLTFPQKNYREQCLNVQFGGFGEVAYSYRYDGKLDSVTINRRKIKFNYDYLGRLVKTSTNRI
ncbi:MAG: hypothetical protein KAH32_02035 [Chlamydiia bacterium]|nr:hypothetical protein [Chlamydiia bacterium]